MKKILRLFLNFLFLIIIVYSLSFFYSKQSLAIYNPLSVPNNKIGVHILFPDELDKAKELINSNGGDWGYVTIPIQAGDKDLKKWQNFMNKSKSLHIIPLIRLATQGDYFDKSSWEAPTDSDVVDFANFLNSLDWPVKNRYIVVFNEVNRSDEWEGEANPSEYAKLLSYAVTVFKSKNSDFFIISSGMDNAAATDGGSFNQYDYFRIMNQEVPGIFNQIDGISSHSYPNPGFSQPPNIQTSRSITSFIYELELIEGLSNKKLPIFITETGWTQEEFSDKVIGDYFKTALENVWNHPQIVAVTPFLLKAGPGPFEKFSLINDNGDENEIFKSLEGIGKIKGKPLPAIAKKVLGDVEVPQNIPIRNFSGEQANTQGKKLKTFVKWLLLPY